MPIRWSATKVSKAMDEVEAQVHLAESFFAEALTKVKEARTIPNLPQYLDQRLIGLISEIERLDRIKDRIQSVRKDIPQGTIEAERERLKYGSQQAII
jgi:ferritin-like metal-binding protein YciE